MKNLFAVAFREFKLVIKDSDLFLIIVLAPLFYTALYGAFYMDKLERKAPIVVIDEDNSLLSKEFIFKCDAHPMLQVTERTHDFEAAKQMLYKEDIYGIIYIPKDFEKHFKQLKGTTVRLYLNNTRFMISNDINRAVNEVKFSYDAKNTVELYERSGMPYEQAKNNAEPFQFEFRNIFNPAETYGKFLIPAVLLLVLQQVMLFGMGQSVSKEREDGTLLQAFQVAGKSISTLLFGKISLYWLSFTFLAFASSFVVINWFGIQMTGDKFFFVGILLLFFYTMSVFSFTLSTFFKKKVYAFVVLSATSYPFFLMTGYAWPHEATPLVIKIISYVSPGTPLMLMLPKIFHFSVGLADVSGAVICLAVQGIVYTFLAGVRLKILTKPANT